ncbi:MAG: response regulator transcription factor [Opitutaceae bacterium]|nr:response regulator transcription factor [Opitutaceae bacterium]
MTEPGAAPLPPRILVVEDEPKTRESLAEGLRLEEWEVQTASTAEDAIAILGRTAFDLVVLDWMLPQKDGIDVLQDLRGRGLQVPVLMLTARTALSDRVEGLDSGADDYLLKPFALAELVARCRALLRRPGAGFERWLRCGDLQLDTRARIAMRSEREIALTPREVDVLEYLLRHQGQIVTRAMLERDVWKQEHRMTSLDNVIDVQIMRLRRKVDGDAADRLIHTIRGVGYRIAKESA